MSALGLLEDLRRRDVSIEADGGTLHLEAPAEVVTEELRDALVEHKQGLLTLLERERTGLEAERCGLVIRWSEYPTWIELRDPLNGEWHEVKASECLPGVIETADRYRRKGG